MTDVITAIGARQHSLKHRFFDDGGQFDACGSQIQQIDRVHIVLFQGVIRFTCLLVGNLLRRESEIGNRRLNLLFAEFLSCLNA